MVQIIFACEGWKSMIRFYILFSLPDKISKIFRVSCANFDILATLNHFLPVKRTNLCRWKCKNRCHNKIFERLCSGDRWSSNFGKNVFFSNFSQNCGSTGRSICDFWQNRQNDVFYTSAHEGLSKYCLELVTCYWEVSKLSHFYCEVTSCWFQTFTVTRM